MNALKKRMLYYAVVWLFVTLVLSVAVWLFASYQETERKYQFARLLESHPELEPELVEFAVGEHKSSKERKQKDFDLLEEQYGYDLAQSREIRALWLFLMVVSTFVIAGMGFFDCRRWKYQAEWMSEQMRSLYEQLECFQAGNFMPVQDVSVFEEIYSGRELQGFSSYSEQWLKLWESLRELGRYFSDLEERFEAEEESTKALITNISHQLKTPLASLRMSYELVLNEKLTKEEKEEFLAQERLEIEKLEMLLEELVNLSRLESHMITILPEPSSLKETVLSAVNQIYRKAKAKDIELSLDMEGDLMVLHDRKWTTEALVNILDNAVKYSPLHKKIEIRVQKLVSQVAVDIVDEGIGIPKEELHNIYQRFYRGSLAVKTEKDGAGVGLYLARTIIEKQDGSILAKNRQQHGTVFKVLLPLWDESLSLERA